MSAGKPMAGTFRLDGMLQGPLPPDQETVDDILRWVKSAEAGGIHFHLSMDGGSYSLVADSAHQRTSRLKGADLGTALSDGLNALLEFLPPSGRTGSFSTVRSEEFRDGIAVQTLYPIGMDGRVSPERRTVDAPTSAAPPEIDPVSLRRAIFPAIIALLLILFVSTFFIDYRKLFSNARDRLVPLSKEELVVSQEFAGDYLVFDLAEVDNKKSALVFHLARGADWKRAMESKPADASAADWTEFATLLAIHRGRFRIELYDKERKLIGTREIDTRELLENESMDIAIVVKSSQRIARAVLRP